LTSQVHEEGEANADDVDDEELNALKEIDDMSAKAKSKAKKPKTNTGKDKK
jgi:hypothetical protein